MFHSVALGSCLIFTGKKFATSGRTLQNTHGDRRFVELMKGAVKKFILTPSLSSCKVLLL